MAQHRFLRQCRPPVPLKIFRVKVEFFLIIYLQKNISEEFTFTQAPYPTENLRRRKAIPARAGIARSSQWRLC